MTTSLNTAVFYDVENLIRGYGCATEVIENLSLQNILHSIRQHVNHLVESSQTATNSRPAPIQIGHVALQRAYANWSDVRLSSLRNDLNEMGIDPIQVFGFSRDGKKNAADIQLAIDVMDVLHIHKHVQVFVIVSGDGGFGALARKLHEYGKTVIGCAYPQCTSESLVAVCDVFVPIGKNSRPWHPLSERREQQQLNLSKALQQQQRHLSGSAAAAVAATVPPVEPPCQGAVARSLIGTGTSACHNTTPRSKQNCRVMAAIVQGMLLPNTNSAEGHHGLDSDRDNGAATALANVYDAHAPARSTGFAATTSPSPFGVELVVNRANNSSNINEQQPSSPRPQQQQQQLASAHAQNAGFAATTSLLPFGVATTNSSDENKQPSSPQPQQQQLTSTHAQNAGFVDTTSPLPFGVATANSSSQNEQPSLSPQQQQTGTPSGAGTAETAAAEAAVASAPANVEAAHARSTLFAASAWPSPFGIAKWANNSSSQNEQPAPSRPQPQSQQQLASAIAQNTGFADTTSLLPFGVATTNSFDLNEPPSSSQSRPQPQSQQQQRLTSALAKTRKVLKRYLSDTKTCAELTASGLVVGKERRHVLLAKSFQPLQYGFDFTAEYLQLACKGTGVRVARIRATSTLVLVRRKKQCNLPKGAQLLPDIDAPRWSETATTPSLRETVHSVESYRNLLATGSKPTFGLVLPSSRRHWSATVRWLVQHRLQHVNFPMALEACWIGLRELDIANQSNRSGGAGGSSTNNNTDWCLGEIKHALKTCFTVGAFVQMPGDVASLSSPTRCWSWKPTLQCVHDVYALFKLAARQKLATILADPIRDDILEDALSMSLKRKSTGDVDGTVDDPSLLEQQNARKRRRMRRDAANESKVAVAVEAVAVSTTNRMSANVLAKSSVDDNGLVNTPGGLETRTNETVDATNSSLVVPALSSELATVLAKTRKTMKRFVHDPQRCSDLKRSGIEISVVRSFIVKAIPDFATLPFGFAKFAKFLQYACAGTQFCLVRTPLAKLMLVLRQRAATMGQLLPDVVRQAPDVHYVETYRHFLSLSPAPIFQLPASSIDLSIIVHWLAEHPLRETYFATAVFTLAGDLQAYAACGLTTEVIQQTLLSLVAAGIFIVEAHYVANAGVSEKRISLRPTIQSANDILWELREATRPKLVRMLGAVDDDVLNSLLAFSPEGAVAEDDSRGQGFTAESNHDLTPRLPTVKERDSTTMPIDASEVALGSDGSSVLITSSSDNDSDEWEEGQLQDDVPDVPATPPRMNHSGVDRRNVRMMTQIEPLDGTAKTGAEFDEQNAILAKTRQVLNWFLHDPESQGDLVRSGIDLSVVQQAIHFVIHRFKPIQLGFAKFTEYMQCACNDTETCVASMPPTKVVLALSRQPPLGAEVLPALEERVVHSVATYQSILSTGRPAFQLPFSAASELSAIVDWLVQHPDTCLTSAVVECWNGLQGQVSSFGVVKLTLLSFAAAGMFVRQGPADADAANTNEERLSLRTTLRSAESIMTAIKDAIQVKLLKALGIVNEGVLNDLFVGSP